MGRRFAHQRFADSCESIRKKMPIFVALGKIRANRVFSPIRIEIRVIRVQSSLLFHFLEGRFGQKKRFFFFCFLLPRPICRNVLEDFRCIKFGGFSRGFSWRIFLGTFSHKNEEKKSGEKIREKIRRLKNKNPRKIRSAESRP